MSLNNTFTSTGAKFFAHQSVMESLRDGVGRPVVTHLMITDTCNHSCAFCSVQARAGDSLPFSTITGYLDILLKYGLKAVILSGGGNPILYRCKDTGKTFADVVDHIHKHGLEMGLITNGMPLRSRWKGSNTTRKSWSTVPPDTLDKLTWVRISMSGFDHEEREVYVPQVDHSKTTLGFSYVAHDLYVEPADPHHGKVSRRLDLLSGDYHREPTISFDQRKNWLTYAITEYCLRYDPAYVRLLPNCLEPERISDRCKQLDTMARAINKVNERDIAFVQYKPPAAPRACYLGYIHPVLNCDGYVYPCDSCVLNEAAGHAFANPWRVCRWDEIHTIYDRPAQSLIAHPAVTCPGCVFHQSNELLSDVRDGYVDLTRKQQPIMHENFV
jgi:hypothetical protein